MTDVPATPTAPTSLRTLTVLSLIFVVLSPLVGLVLAIVDLVRSRRRGAAVRATAVALALNGISFCATLMLAYLLPWLVYMVANRNSGGPQVNPFEYSAAIWSIVFG